MLLGILVLQNPANVDSQIANPLSEAKAVLTKLDSGFLRTLLHHFVGEQNRAYLSSWTMAQLILGGVLILLCAFSPRKQLIPLGVFVVMTILVAIQHYSILPELAFLGRQADFLTADAAASYLSQASTTSMFYGITEGVKLVIGGVLASYLFASQNNSSSNRKRRRSTDSELSHSRNVA